ncbi:MAG: hypothetical protein AAB338_02025 [Patescibacteria group bacterium]
MLSQLMEGWIDEHGHPVMPVQLIGLEDPIVALIDTGFNRELIVYEEHSQQAQLVIESESVSVLLADGSQEEFLRTEGVIEWFGEPRRVDILVIPGQAPRKGRWQIGTQLLRDCRLEIDFRERSVKLSRHV